MQQILLALILAVTSAASTLAQERFIVLGSTTSTEQSGLFGHLLPAFKDESGIAVRVVAVGAGQALQLARRGDGDALLTHDRVGEDALVNDGFAVNRRDAMHNDFVLIGPEKDPAKIAGLNDAVTALKQVAGASAPFASRGDDSGTHRAELRLWQAAGVALSPRPAWYRELGSGMGPTLNSAAAMDAYVLADRGTWASFKNRGSLAILAQGDTRLFNPYSSLLVNAAKHAHVKAADAKRWHEWLTGPKGKAMIASFRVGGEQLFFPATPH
jgi:tungstate transport system substrate-binding protein